MGQDMSKIQELGKRFKVHSIRLQYHELQVNV